MRCDDCGCTEILCKQCGKNYYPLHWRWMEDMNGKGVLVREIYLSPEQIKPTRGFKTRLALRTLIRRLRAGWER